MLTLSNSRKTTLVLCVALALLLSEVYNLQSSNERVQATVTANVMYLVPADNASLESNLSPAEFRKSGEIQVGYSSTWKPVEDLANQGQLQALIIHHAAVDQVNQPQLEKLFQHGGLVVAGIGIPPTQLATLIGMPGLNIWGDDPVYRTKSYFYMFSIYVKGSREDTQNVISDLSIGGTNVPPENVQNPMSISVRRSTDSLLVVNGVPRFIETLKLHLRSAGGR